MTPTVDHAGAVVLEEHASGNLKVEILQHQELYGSTNPAVAQQLFYAAHMGLTLKRVKYTLQDSAVLLEPGALHYMRGDLELTSSTGEGGGMLGFGKALFKSAVGGESLFKTRIEGSGEVYLEPTFGHFIVQSMEDSEFNIDDGIFSSGDGNLSIETEKVASLATGLFGEGGFFESKIAGTGLVVFESPVPVSEVETIELTGEKLYVDGNFMLMRTGDLEYNVEKSSKSWFGSYTSGEGLLQNVSGTGTVWLAPTQASYQRLEGERSVILNTLSSIDSKISKLQSNNSEG